MAKYGPKAHELVEREMEQLKAGKLRSGSGEKVTDRKQAIAIALSEARRSGVKMPAPPPGTASADKAPSDDRAARRTAAKTKSANRAASEKPAAKKTPSKKSPPRKAAAKKGQTATIAAPKGSSPAEKVRAKRTM